MLSFQSRRQRVFGGGIFHGKDLIRRFFTGLPSRRSPVRFPYANAVPCDFYSGLLVPAARPTFVLLSGSQRGAKKKAGPVVMDPPVLVCRVTFCLRVPRRVVPVGIVCSAVCAGRGGHGCPVVGVLLWSWTLWSLSMRRSRVCGLCLSRPGV